MKWDCEEVFQMGLPGHDMAVALVNQAPLDLGSQPCAPLVSGTDSFLCKRHCDIPSNSPIGSACMNLPSRGQSKSIRIHTLSNRNTNTFFESDGALNCKDWPAFNNWVCSSPGCISPSFLLFDELRGSGSSSRLKENACSSSPTTNTFCTSSLSVRTNGLRTLRCHAADIEARHEDEPFIGFIEEAWSSSSGCLSPSFICFDELRTRDATFGKSLGMWEVQVDHLFSHILSSYEVLENSSFSVSKPLDEEALVLLRKLASLHLGTRSDAFSEVRKVQRVNSIDGKEGCASLPSSELTGSGSPSLYGRTSFTDSLPQNPLPAIDEVPFPTGLDKLEGLEDDGPLFWPFDQNCFRYHELNWDLSISPSRKNRVDACVTPTFRHGKNTNFQLRRSAIQNSRRKNQACRPHDHSVFDYDSTKEGRPTSSPNVLAKIRTRASICTEGDKMAADKQTCSGNSLLKMKNGVKSRLGVQMP
ncbi:uncharacterized protein LOC116251222 isoform X1 [Nymphaea colorata]|uniref:uncharacterized protein LOC116251222 isoform X1 n=2 Tax=Nymphaea colorata TaxID=210225 RepID=UPI00129E8586|nr:uncharacterized protein LOC116251222 isoform X1 [Nymphaea colorata]